MKIDGQYVRVPSSDVVRSARARRTILNGNKAGHQRQQEAEAQVVIVARSRSAQGKEAVAVEQQKEQKSEDTIKTFCVFLPVFLVFSN